MPGQLLIEELTGLEQCIQSGMCVDHVRIIASWLFGVFLGYPV